MAKIYAPVKDYNGISAGVSFREGIGECSSPYLLKWFREHGYKVEEMQEPVEDEEKPEETQEPVEDEETKKKNRKSKE